MILHELMPTFVNTVEDYGILYDGISFEFTSCHLHPIFLGLGETKKICPKTHYPIIEQRAKAYDNY